MSAGHGDDAANIDEAKLALALRSRDLEAAACMSLYSELERVPHRDQDTHWFVIVILVATLNHIFHSVVVNEKCLLITKANVFVVDIL